MSNIVFGFCLPIFAWPGAGLFRTPAWATLDAQRCIQLGVLAERLGYGSLWVADHLMLGADEAILEGWTTLAALAGMSQAQGGRAKLGIIHYNHVFRHPAFTAKMVSTLDQISNGRMIHFVDFGNNSREYLAYGMYHDDASEQARRHRIAQMIEGLDLTLALWQSDEPVTFKGQHYSTHNAVCTPKPVQEKIPIWMGEVWPGIVEATVKYADGWNTVPVPMPELRRRLAMLQAECDKQGRDIATLEKTLEIQVLIAPTLAGLREKLRGMLALVPEGQTITEQLQAFVSGDTDELPDEMKHSWWAGTPEQVIARVRECVGLGFTHFMLWFVDAPDDSGLRLFAERVMPRFA